jgi:membrane-associated phospholipid phosphatase
MNLDQHFGPLLRRSFLALAASLVLVVGCYFWVDRPVAFYVYHHQLADYRIFKWLTFPPPTVQTWSPLVLAVLMIRRAWGPLTHCQKALFVACLSLIVADEFRTSLGGLCGRYWPETWFDHNPSLIGTGTYGFHAFQSGDDIGSFPSGHATRILSFVGVWWLVAPRSRVFLTLASLPMLGSLIAMDYHFVSDVIFGCVLGGIVAAYAVRLADLDRADS